MYIYNYTLVISPKEECISMTAEGACSTQGGVLIKPVKTLTMGCYKASC